MQLNVLLDTTKIQQEATVVFVLSFSQT